MKTSKWFYGIALASLVSFTAAADTTTTTSTSGTTSSGQSNLIIQGTKSGSDNQGPKPAPKPTTDKTPTTINGNVVNPGT